MRRRRIRIDQDDEGGVHHGEHAEIIHEGQDLPQELGLPVEHRQRLESRRHRVGAVGDEVVGPLVQALGGLRVPDVDVGDQRGLAR